MIRNKILKKFSLWIKRKQHIKIKIEGKARFNILLSSRFNSSSTCFNISAITKKFDHVVKLVPSSWYKEMVHWKDETIAVLEQRRKEKLYENNGSYYLKNGIGRHSGHFCVHTTNEKKWENVIQVVVNKTTKRRKKKNSAR